MKKMVALALAIAMLVSLASVASAMYDVYDWRVLYEHDELYECAGNRGEVR